MKQKNKLSRNIGWYYLPLVGWIVFIWILSSQHGSGYASLSIWSPEILWRKVAHVVEFFVLFFLVFRVISLRVHVFSDQILWSLVLVLWFAVVDESHQTFVPGREGKPLDVFIDMLGVFSCITFLVFLRRCRILKKKK